MAGGRRQGGDRADEEKKPPPREGSRAEKKRTATDYGRAVQQQPHPRQQAEITIAIKRRGQQRANDHRRGKTEREFAARAGEERHAGSMGLLSHSKHGKHHSQARFHEPYENPASRGRLM